MLSAISRTPFRVSFFGGGTDYPAWFRQHGGAVLSIAINKYCYIGSGVLPPFFGIKHRVVWSHIEGVHSMHEILHPAVKGGLQAMAFDDDEGIEIFHQGDLPARSGIGSSSAFAVGLINVLSTMRGAKLDAKALAEKAIDLEQNKLKENVGCQDQIASAFGGLNVIDFKRDGSFAVSPVALDEARRTAFEKSLMLFYMGSSRIASEFANRVIRSLEANARQMTRLHEMVPIAADLLKAGKIDDFGRLLHEGWMLKRGLAEGTSTAAIDRAYEDARRAGALGGKLLGAGGTGFMVFVVPADRRHAVREALSNLTEVPVAIDFSGSSIVYRNEEFIGAGR
ncbi:MAG: kinase [Alphaproteobacteria bacterium]|nr:kinase [Alphaproteobacteria bacterium]